MNKPGEPLFSTRPTVILELPLNKHSRILHPEQVILKIADQYLDVGALCYALRSSKNRKPRQPREVVTSSLRKQRRQEIVQLIKALSDLLTNSGKSLNTIFKYGICMRLFIDWADANDQHYCLAGGETSRNAFRSWATDTHERYRRQRWPLSTQQLRRSLALYANASGLVSLPSLRRQLQHITREMSLYYGRGSTFCKNFITNDPEGYKQHLASEWQEGEDEAMMLAFTREVLNSTEPLFGGAGNFYQRQKERGKVMSREEVTKQMKAGLLSYQPGPLGGCTKTGGCDKRKGLALIDISCATDGCKNLVGKHSKIIRAIQLKRAAMAHITRGSIEDAIEKEELAALERVEREWRPLVSPSLSTTGGAHA